MLLSRLNSTSIVLGSQSPRRRELLESLDLSFEVVVKSIDETLPEIINPKDAAEYIALKKLEAFLSEEFGNHLVITADTVVVNMEGEVLGKPINLEDAVCTLTKLSGKRHHVFTGVGILYNQVRRSFTSVTEVVFNELTNNEIEYYVNKYRPFDKAGSYGIQEWIGRIAIHEIIGSYENVMGLPTSRLYQELKEIEKGL